MPLRIKNAFLTYSFSMQVRHPPPPPFIPVD
jgi:hypothetical protein